MKEHVVTGLTHFSIMTDNYMPGTAASDDVTILSAEYTPNIPDIVHCEGAAILVFGFLET